MKNIAIIVLVLSSFITGCDRDTLQGLNLKINAEVKSDYENQTTPESNNNSSTEPQANQEARSTSSAPETAQPQPTKVSKEPDPDTPMAFKEVTDCSESGIRAKTNEIFYANNSQVKSIDSKNEKQVKEWKKIYQKVEASCK